MRKPSKGGDHLSVVGKHREVTRKTRSVLEKGGKTGAKGNIKEGDPKPGGRETNETRGGGGGRGRSQSRW